MQPMQPRQGPLQNPPNRAPYKAQSGQPIQSYEVTENIPARRRPPIQSGGVGRGLTNPAASTLPTVSSAGYTAPRHQVPQSHNMPTTQPQPQTGGYSFNVFPGQQAPINQQNYFPMYNQPVVSQLPQQTKQPQATNVNPAHHPVMSQPAGRKPPVPHSNQPLTSQFGSEIAVENQQSLQMPVSVPHVAPTRQPVPSGPFVAPHGRQPLVTATTTQVVQSTGPLQAPFGAAPQQRSPIVSGPSQSATEVQKPLVASQLAAKAAPTTSATVVAANASAPALSTSVAKPTALVPQATTDASGKAGTAQEQTGSKRATAAAAPSTVTPNKPWIQFTGPGKKEPIAAWATVRQVISGHSFRLALISSKQTSGPPKVIDFLLEGIRTPAVARNEKTSDEPYGYEAREFVRNLVSAGAPVLCCAWNVREEKGNRFYGDIYISTGKNANDPKANKESLTYLIVSNGFADLNPKEKTQLSPTEFEKLSKALEKAKKSNLGKFADGGASTSTEEEKKKTNDNKKKGGKQQAHVRKLVFAKTPEERSKLFNKYQNKEIPAIVDHVKSGSVLCLELIPDEKNNVHELVLVNLAGCVAPRTAQPQNENAEKANKKKNQGNRKADRYGNEAKEFTEQRLLSQRITVKFVATDQKFLLYGKVSHPKGNVAVSLLRNGLAEYEPWTSELLSKEDQKAMKEALKSAQEKRLHIWQYKKPDELPHDYVPVTVTQVISGDTFIARFEDGTEERFILSSIHQPRVKEDSKQKSKKADKKKDTQPPQFTEHPWARSAKAFLREKLIDKKVSLLYEYKKIWKNQTDEQSESKTQKNESRNNAETKIQKFASVLVDKENVAVSLVAAGLAEVIPYGQEKSVAYVELQKAQEKAKKAKKGIHSGTTPKEIVDYSKGLDNVPLNVVIALQNYLQDHKRKAVVELVISGNRMKLYLPEQDCFITLMLAYVVCDPLPKRSKDQGRVPSPFGTAALKYVNQQILQRNVEVEIVGSKDKGKGKGKGKDKDKDNTSSWKGKVWINGKDLGLDLLEKGLARVFRPPQPFILRGKRPNMAPEAPSAYLEAEAAAREKLVGRWKEIIAKKHEYEERKRQNDMTGKEVTIVVSHIISGVQFWVNRSDNNELEKLEVAMSRLRPQPVSVLRPKKLVGALYDGLNCRARLLTKQQDHSWLVLFIDYGNRAVVAEKDLIGLSPDVSLDKFRPMAQSCRLAALRPPRPNTEHFNASGEHFASLVMPDRDKPLKELKAKVLHDDNRYWHLVLFDQNINVNEQMVKEGHARFDQKRVVTPKELLNSKDEFTQEYLKTIAKLNDEALEGRRGLWELGDANTDEEEGF